MATKKKAAKKPKEMLLVQSKVKDHVRQAGFMCSSDLIDQLNDEVAEMLQKAVERAEANGRKTARASDV